jgi:hypothetical protein
MLQVFCGIVLFLIVTALMGSSMFHGDGFVRSWCKTIIATLTMLVALGVLSLLLAGTLGLLN